MLIYLDQNKWIEIAKVIHGKDSTPRGKHILDSLLLAIDLGSATIPLSAIHYIELSRISNVGRRKRLGEAMWRLSQGKTIAGYPAIVRHELKASLSIHFPIVCPNDLQLLGWGSHHAFGASPPIGISALMPELVEKSLLAGNEKLGIDPPSTRATQHQENFQRHLSTLYQRSREVPSELLENWLYATLMIDMLEPLNEIFDCYGIGIKELGSLGEEKLKQIINDMPTRQVDIHLHRQVLRNPNYVSKITDLEDWAGIVAAACYCDVVVCEKHMADMLRRDGFKTRARIETDLENVFS